MGRRIDGTQFLKIARPLLAAGDAQVMAQEIAARWPADELGTLFYDENVDVRRIAAVALGLLGDLRHADSLTRALWDPDEQVNEMAEHGLWSIWFRGGAPAASAAFREGVALLGIESYDRAVIRFQEASRIDPYFAEAYNQCAISYYFLDQWQNSIRQSMRALQLIPSHFGAMGGMGHCHAQLGQLEMALQCYRKALRINPRMPAIARTVQRIEQSLQGQKDDSGQFLLDKVNV